MLILGDVFETFPNASLTRRKITVDPANYVRAPQMATVALLKKIGALT